MVTKNFWWTLNLTCLKELAWVIDSESARLTLSEDGHRMLTKGRRQDGSGLDVHHLWPGHSEMLPCGGEASHFPCVL